MFFILESLAMSLDLSVMELIKGEKLVSNQILADEAEQSMQDVFQLFSNEFKRTRVPKSIRRFFAPQTYCQGLAMILLILGSVYVIVGGILFFYFWSV